MRNRLYGALLLCILLALAFFIVGHDSEIFDSLSADDFSSLTINAVMAVVIGSTVIVLFREQLSKALKAALLWTAVALVLLVGYTYRFEVREVADRVMAEVAPGWAAQKGNTVEIARSRGGDFSVRAQINGARVSMVLDSGASAVVLTQEAAKAAGLPLEVLQYSTSVETANGRTRVAPVTLDRLAIGDIVERSVPALIAQPGQLKSNLLGMSFLNRLESWEVRGDKLLLRAYP
jgi:aspartyl protease family protein